MSVQNFCSNLWRPFYGWMDYFFCVAVWGLVRNFYEHGKEWLLFLTLLCTFLNIPLDIYISYLYFFSKFNFFYEPALEVRIAIAGVTLTGSLMSIIFIWTIGNSLLIITDSNRNTGTTMVKRSEKVFSEDLDTQKSACTATDADNNEMITEDIPTAEQKTKKQKIFPTFKLFSAAIYLLIVSLGSNYFIYSYIISCSPMKQSATIAKLIITGLFLPVLMTISVLRDIYTIHKGRKCSKRFKPIALLFSTSTVLTGIASIWIFTFSVHRRNQLTATTPAVGLEYNKADMETSSVILLHQQATIFIANAADILSTPDFEVRFECTKKHEKIGILCEEINFLFQYIKQKQTVDYTYEIKHGNYTSNDDEIDGSIEWSCDLCHEGTVITGKNTKNSNTSRNLKPCGITSNWLYYALAGYTVLVLITYSAVLAKAVTKKQTGPTLDNAKGLLSLSSKIQPYGVEEYEGTTIPAQTNLPRNKISAPQLKELEITSAWKNEVMHGTNLSVLQMNGRNSLATQPRIIRVPKGTALGMMRRETK